MGPVAAAEGSSGASVLPLGGADDGFRLGFLCERTTTAASAVSPIIDTMARIREAN